MRAIPARQGVVDIRAKTSPTASPTHRGRDPSIAPWSSRTNVLSTTGSGKPAGGALAPVRIAPRLNLQLQRAAKRVLLSSVRGGHVSAGTTAHADACGSARRGVPPGSAERVSVRQMARRQAYSVVDVAVFRARDPWTCHDTRAAHGGAEEHISMLILIRWCWV